FIAEVRTSNEAKLAPQQSMVGSSQNTISRLPESKSVLTQKPVGSEMPGETKAGFRLGGSKLVVGVLILVLIVAAGLVIWKNQTKTGQAEAINVLRTVQITSWSGLDYYPAISPDGNTVAFSSDRTGSFEIYVKRLVGGSGEVPLTSDGGQNFEPAFSSNGSLIAYHSRKRGGIWIIPVTGGTAKQLNEFGSNPAWSPDGSQIAFQSSSTIAVGFNDSNAQPPSTLWLVSAEGGEPRQLTEVGNPVGGHGAPSWSPDGKRIAFDSSDYAT